MTNPAVLRIYSDDHDGAFASDWAAPEKVLPCLARWVEWCAVSNVMPTATSYFEFAAADDGDHFRADYGVDAPDPDQAEYRYVVRSGAMDEGWIADLTIWRSVPRAGREPLLTVWHQVTFSRDTTGPLHQLRQPDGEIQLRTVEVVLEDQAAFSHGPIIGAHPLAVT